MKYLLLFASCSLLLAAFPIEISDIDMLFPPQQTFLDSNGNYETRIDKQVGQEEEEKKAVKACIPKQQSVVSDDEAAGVLDKSENDGFVDESPINGTIVDDPMEVKIYKAECDD